tara:strand:+ start:7330 stop:7839 length:510 start_codon:yes stop_codon:yes gene_type:complete
MANTASPYSIITVTPTLTAGEAYADGDVLFEPTEIPNAVLGNGGCCKLIKAFLIDYDRDTFTADIIFTEKSTPAIGTKHATAGITDADFRTTGFIGALKFDNQSTVDDIDNVKPAELQSLSGAGESVDPMLLQAADDSTSVYVSAVLASGSPTFTNTNDIQLVLHIQKK